VIEITDVTLDVQLVLREYQQTELSNRLGWLRRANLRAGKMPAPQELSKLLQIELTMCLKC
jgi:hypothetical protein